METWYAPSTEPLLTVEEFEALPEEEGKVELSRGRLVREPPVGASHGWVAVNLAVPIREHVRRHGLGAVFVEVGYVLSREPATVRGPDLSFLAADRLPPEGMPPGFWRLAPDLAVEIVSPSNTLPELQEKVLQYLEAGTRLVWIVDPTTRTAIEYRSRDDIRLLTGAEELDGGDVLPGFRVTLREIFEG